MGVGGKKDGLRELATIIFENFEHRDYDFVPYTKCVTQALVCNRCSIKFVLFEWQTLN